jgi:chromate reductase
MHKVAVIVGSIRKDSINKVLAGALEKLAAGKLDMQRLRIDDLPLFNQDNEGNPPPEVTRLKQAIAASDAVLLVTPEHNRSIPAALKNAIDWATRPYGTSALRGKVGAITGASKGNISTAVAQQHLKSIAGPHFVALLGSPELYVNFKDEAFDAQGNVIDEALKKRLVNFLDKFATLTAALAKT